MTDREKRSRMTRKRDSIRRNKKGAPQQTTRARLILRYAKDSAKSLLEACDKSRKARRASGGATTHAEQDFLRAMVVFAASGLDSLLKHLIRDALTDLARKDRAVQKELEKFIERQLKSGETDAFDISSGAKFLSRLLADPKPYTRLVEEYIQVLTGTSLQSEEQLFRSAGALGLSPEEAGLNRQDLREIFDARNQIIHELDIRLTGNRTRRTRRRDPMKEYADALLEIGEKFITAVENKLRATS